MSGRWVLAGCWFWVLSAPSLAAIEATAFPDETIKARYYDLIAMLRCPQCLNTNLAGSDAMIAQNLRATVRRLLIEGKTDAEVKQFMFERYGDFILYEPRWTAKTWLLWLGPFGLVLIGLSVWWSMGASSRKIRHGLSDSDRASLKRLMDR